MGSLRSLRRKEPVPLPGATDQDLFDAAIFGTIRQTEDLLRRGANPNAIGGRWTAMGHYFYKAPVLCDAAYYGKIIVTRLLVKYGADVNMPKPGVDTPP